MFVFGFKYLDIFIIMNTLFTILSALDRKEMTRFKDFALSPYHNKHSGVKEILLYLNGLYPQFSEKNCGNRALAKALFPGKKESAAQVPVFLTYVRRLLYEFLDTEAYQKSSLSKSIFLLSQLREKKQTNIHLKHLDQERTNTDEQEVRDSAYFHKRFLLDGEADQMYTEQAVGKEKGALQQKAHHLDAYYLSEKLKDACEMLVRSRMVKVDYSSILLEAILQVVQENKERYFKIPPVNVYYHIYQMIVNEEVQYYETAFQAVEQFAPFFPTEELQNIYNYLQNYCVDQINKSRSEFLRASFQLYQIQLEKRLLFIGDLLPEWHYKNIVTAGLGLGEVDWVRQFLERYRPFLMAEVQENAYSYNLAQYYYATEEYKKAMQLLLQVSYTDARYSMSAKALLLKIYYDLEEHEALVALCKSFVQALQRDRSISDFRRKGYTHLFKLTQKASQLRYRQPFRKVEKSKLALEKLKEELAIAKPFNKRWLEERLGRL
ncbi:MAG: hypothetical protein ACI8YQ_000574 [Polaribacter sp.]